MRLPIRVRLTAWYAALLAAIMLALGGFLTLQLEADLEQDVEREVRAGSAQIALGYAKEGAGGLPRREPHRAPPRQLRRAGPVSRRSRAGCLRGAAGPPADRAPGGDEGRAQRQAAPHHGQARPQRAALPGNRLTCQTSRPGPGARRRRVVAACRGVRGPGAPAAAARRTGGTGGNRSRGMVAGPQSAAARRVA